MDLSNLNVVEKSNAGKVLLLTHPVTGEVLTDEKGKKPKEFYLKLLGSDSDVYRNAIKRHFERSQNKKNKKTDIDEIKLKSAELLAKCTTECFMIEDGKEVECKQSEMIRLYLKYPWLMEQAEEFISERDNFLD